MSNYKNLFPEFVSNPNLSYFDWASSCLKPLKIIDSEIDFLKNSYSPVGRGSYPIANNANAKIDTIRESVRSFINADSKNQIVFNSGTTMGLNTAAMMIRQKISPDSIVVVSDLDHHSLRLVWENFAKLGLCKLWVCPINSNGTLDLVALEKKVKNDNVAVACITAMSNTFGVKQDLKKISRILKNVISVVDFAQWVAHEKVDVSDFDFACFSGHKIYADSGVGVLYIKNPEDYNPVIFGGGMVRSVSEKSIAFENPPHKFEAGTLPVSQIISLGASVDFISEFGYKKIKSHTENLSAELVAELKKIKGIKFLNPDIKNEPVIAFNVKNISPLDLAALLGLNGVCVRAGNHCAGWIHNYLKINSSLRFSLGLGTDENDVLKAITEIKKAIKKLS